MQIPLPRFTPRRVLNAATILAALAVGFEAGRRTERRVRVEAKRASVAKRDELLGLLRAEIEEQHSAIAVETGEFGPPEPE